MSSFTSGLKYEPTGTLSEFGIPQYKLLEGFSYAVGSLENPVAILTVPAGTITDFASIPWPINIWFKPTVHGLKLLHFMTIFIGLIQR